MIVVFGTVCLDRIRRVPFIPGVGSYVEVVDEQTFLGGEAANSANALAAWGASVQLASNPLGDDANGQDLRRRTLARPWTLTELGATGPVQAPICDVLVTPDGERTMIGKGFSALDLVIDLKRLPKAEGKWFTAEPNMEDASRRAVRMAAAAGMRTYVMDFVRDFEPIGPDSVWQASTDSLGVRGDHAANLTVVRERFEAFGGMAILTDGPAGLYVAAPNISPRFLPAYPAPAVVDTTGAGDTFRAGMLYGLDRNWKTAACLQFAAAAAALSCGYPGATTRVPTLSEIAQHISANPDVAAAYVGF